jgi:hypothetical protein
VVGFPVGSLVGGAVNRLPEGPTELATPMRLGAKLRRAAARRGDKLGKYNQNNNLYSVADPRLNPGFHTYPPVNLT